MLGNLDCSVNLSFVSTLGLNLNFKDAAMFVYLSSRANGKQPKANEHRFFASGFLEAAT